MRHDRTASSGRPPDLPHAQDSTNTSAKAANKTCNKHSVHKSFSAKPFCHDAESSRASLGNKRNKSPRHAAPRLRNKSVPGRRPGPSRELRSPNKLRPLGSWLLWLTSGSARRTRQRAVKAIDASRSSTRHSTASPRGHSIARPRDIRRLGNNTLPRAVGPRNKWAAQPTNNRGVSHSQEVAGPFRSAQ
jgi:hypothetical protein